MKCGHCGSEQAITLAMIERRVRDYVLRGARAVRSDIEVFISAGEYAQLERAVEPALVYPHSAGLPPPTMTMHGSFGRIRIWPYGGSEMVIGEASP